MRSKRFDYRLMIHAATVCSPDMEKQAQKHETAKSLFSNVLCKKKKMTPEQIVLAKAVGRRLTWLRLLVGRTQSQMIPGAADQGQWSRWESGERLIPPLAAIEVCNRLRVSLDYIYRGHLIGVHPDLARKLLEQYRDELIPPPIYTGYHTDMAHA